MFVVNQTGIGIPQVRDVRVRDNYSFVDLDPAIVETVLGKMNGLEHEGRTVKAELARKQRGEAAPAASPAAAPAATGGSPEGGSAPAPSTSPEGGTDGNG